MTPDTNAMLLPRIRQELALHPGPAALDGSPTWTLQDPSRSAFFRIDWLTFEILCNWSLGHPAKIAAAVSQDSPLDASPEDVMGVAGFLSSNHLLEHAGRDTSADLARAVRKEVPAWLWLIHNYLFFRVPLIRPNALLGALVGRTRFLFGPVFLLASALALAAGLALVWRQWDSFRTSLVDTFTLQGLLAYGLTIFAVKIIHEFGHGLTARRFGCNVPSMGVAFLVMWPVPYTDTNEAWKLRNRRERLLVASAGVASELLIAIWATLAWSLLDDGHLRTAAFLLATTTWVSTLLVNCSPFMRFDGYFILCDLLDTPNLHARSFALARWQMREWLFGLGSPVPETFPPARHRLLVGFAWLTWIYRLVVFLGIAVLVYAFFIKLVGIVLFLVEIVWFVAMPIARELKVWHENRGSIARSPRVRYWLVLLALAALGLAMPLPWGISSSGLLRPGENLAVYAPEGARVDRIFVRDGDTVAADAPLFALSATHIDERRSAARSRVERLQSQIATASVSIDSRARLPVLQAELQTALATLRALNVQGREFRPLAPQAGRVRLVDPDLRPGVWVARHEHLATIVHGNRWTVEAYVDERDVRRVSEGQSALFYPDGAAHRALALNVLRVDRDASHILPDGQLARQSGGSVLAREQDGRFFPENAVYRVELEVENPSEAPEAGFTHRGTVVLHPWAESLLLRAGKHALSLLWRESGF